MTSESMTAAPLRLDQVEATAGNLAGLVRETPTWALQDELVERLLPQGTRPLLKLELFQYAGSFKARGALSVIQGLGPGVLARGVTAVSAGNHAIAVAWAAGTLGTTAKVVMPETADPFRVARCAALGAEVVLTKDVHAAFALADRIEREEGRAMVHPFEGPRTALGTATLGRELLLQAPEVEAVIVPVGGGGLAAGVSAAIKLIKPSCLVIGVEPEANDVMHRSLQSGKPERAPEGGYRTIADSLSPPYTMPYSLGLCRQNLDDLVLVSDDAMRESLAIMFRCAKLAVEPAGASALAALLGPLRDRLGDKVVALIVCGSNIAPQRYVEHLTKGIALLDHRVVSG